MGDIKEIFEAMVTRARSPLFGYFSLSFMATNWKAIFYLLFSDVEVINRIEYFEANTGITSLLWIPLGISIVAALLYPWIQYGFIYVTSFPNNRRNEINARSESNLLLVKIDLENKRNELVRQKEKQVIEQAKIDESIEGISSDEARKKAKEKIQSIRNKSEHGNEFYDKSLLQSPLNENTLNTYLVARFPHLPINNKINELLLKDIDLSKYRSIEDIDFVLDKSRGFVDFYKNINPDVFKYSVDYVTKSLGFWDSEFRKKHGFSNETLNAIKKYDSA